MPDVDPPSLTLERFAAVSALIDAGAPRDEVLQKAGLSHEAWAREQTAWLGAMSQQARMRRFSLQDRFNEQLLSYLDALEAGAELEIADGQTLGRGTPANSRPKPVDGSSRSVSAPPTPVVAPVVAPLVAPPLSPPSISYDDPPPSSTFPVPPPAYDFDEAPASQPPASQAPSSRTLEPPSTTLPEPASALPFVKPAIGVVPPPPGRVLVSDPVRTGETYDDPPRRPSNTLPFKRPPPKIDLSQTWDGNAKLNAAATLPFSGAPAKGALPPQRPSLEDGATPFGGVRKPDPPKVDPSRLASTMLVDDLGPGETPALTLEQFASLSAEVAFDRGNQTQIEQRYGLDAAAHDREKRAWAARFLKDQALSERYRVKLDEFKAWLAQRRP